MLTGPLPTVSPELELPSVVVPAVWVNEFPARLLPAAMSTVPLELMEPLPSRDSVAIASVPVLSSAPWRWLAPLFVVVEVIVPALVSVAPTMFRVPWVVSVEPRLMVPLLVCEAATSRRPWVTEGTPATRIV